MFPEVEVYRYVTEQTFDAYLYQLVESKQKFISQIMTSKSPVRSAEDVDEVALSFAEVVKRSGRSKEALLRAMVKGYRLCEKPDPEFYQIMRELSAIGNRINQLAVKANALGFVDTPMLREETEKWRQFQIDVRKK